MSPVGSTNIHLVKSTPRNEATIEALPTTPVGVGIVLSGTISTDPVVTLRLLARRSLGDLKGRCLLHWDEETLESTRCKALMMAADSAYFARSAILDDILAASSEHEFPIPLNI